MKNQHKSCDFYPMNVTKILYFDPMKSQAKQLLSIIRSLRGRAPIAGRLPRKHGVSHRGHWEGWLSEYDGPGYYNRRPRPRSARFIYEHLHSVPMLIWLAEMAGVRRALLIEASRVGAPDPSAYRDSPAAAAAVRRIIPWNLVHEHLCRRSCKATTLQDFD